MAVDWAPLAWAAVTTSDRSSSGHRRVRLDRCTIPSTRRPAATALPMSRTRRRPGHRLCGAVITPLPDPRSRSVCLRNLQSRRHWDTGARFTVRRDGEGERYRDTVADARTDFEAQASHHPLAVADRQLRPGVSLTIRTRWLLQRDERWTMAVEAVPVPSGSAEASRSPPRQLADQWHALFRIRIHCRVQWRTPLGALSEAVKLSTHRQASLEDHLSSSGDAASWHRCRRTRRREWCRRHIRSDARLVPTDQCFLTRGAGRGASGSSVEVALSFDGRPCHAVVLDRDMRGRNASDDAELLGDRCTPSCGSR